MRYEVGVPTGKANIVWVAAPFPCGAFQGVKIFRDDLKTRLNPGDSVIDENGYADERDLRQADANEF